MADAQSCVQLREIRMLVERDRPGDAVPPSPAIRFSVADSPQRNAGRRLAERYALKKDIPRGF